MSTDTIPAHLDAFPRYSTPLASAPLAPIHSTTLSFGISSQAAKPYKYILALDTVLKDNNTNSCHQIHATIGQLRLLAGATTHRPVARCITTGSDCFTCVFSQGLLGARFGQKHFRTGTCFNGSDALSAVGGGGNSNEAEGEECWAHHRRLHYFSILLRLCVTYSLRRNPLLLGVCERLRGI